MRTEVTLSFALHFGQSIFSGGSCKSMIPTFSSRVTSAAGRSPPTLNFAPHAGHAFLVVCATLPLAPLMPDAP